MGIAQSQATGLEPQIPPTNTKTHLHATQIPAQKATGTTTTKPVPTPPDGWAALLQLRPLPLAPLHDVLVLLCHLWGHWSARLPEGQDLGVQRDPRGPCLSTKPPWHPWPHLASLEALRDRYLPSAPGARGQRPAR